MIRLLTVLMLGGLSAQAQTITETFGSGANQFSIDFVQIGNPGNAADDTGFGSVAYVYNLGKFEISRDQIEKANSAGGLGLTLADMTSSGGNGVNRPATGLSWYEAAKFVNYLNTSQNRQVAYSFDGGGNFQLWGAGHYSGTNQYRHKDAYYFLPSLDEWYKGAYGSLNGTWHDFTTGSDSVPIKVISGTLAGTAVFGHGTSTGPADITNSGGDSSFGTMAQGGNVFEWTESAYDGVNDSASEGRSRRGGSWMDGSNGLLASYHESITPTAEAIMYGFRIASVPEPSSLSLLLAGGAVLMAGRRKS